MEVDFKGEDLNFNEDGLDVKPKNKKSKKIIIFIVIALIAFSVTGAAFFLPNFGEIKGNINQTFNTKFDYNIITSDEEINGLFEIKDGSLISKDKGLKQKISVGEFVFESNESDKITFSDLNIISDNEKIYLKLGEYSDDLSYLLSLLPSKLENKLKDGNYIKIDNSKSIVNVLGELANEKTLKKLAVGLATSNPLEYYKQDDTYDKLIEYISSDKILNFVFSDGEYDENTKKTNIIINKDICVLSPLIENLLSKSDYGEMITFSKENCEEYIGEANGMIGLINIYKEGNVESGDYSFIINQGKILDIKLEYKNHFLDNWYFGVSDLDGMMSAKINGDIDGINSSLIKIDITEDGITLKGNIVDGTGEININSEVEDINLNGKLIFKDYNLSLYDIVGEYNLYGDSSKLNAKGNLEEGKIVFEMGDEVNLDFSYKNFTYDLRVESDFFNVESSLSKDYKFLANLSILDGTESKLNLEGINLKNTYTITGKAINEDGVIGEGEIAFIDNKGQFSIKGNIKNIEENIDIKINLKHNYVNGNAKYDIPNESEEVEVNINEIIVMPNFEEIGDIDSNTAVLGIGALGVAGTVGFISLQGYSSDAINSKIYSDLSSLSRVIMIKGSEGIDYKDMIKLDSKYAGKDIYIDNEELIFGENYFVGTLNYGILGINSNSFSSPNGSEYIVGIINTEDNTMFQVLGILEGGDKEAILKGNFYQISEDDAEGLIYIDGDVVENGDYIY